MVTTSGDVFVFEGSAEIRAESSTWKILEYRACGHPQDVVGTGGDDKQEGSRTSTTAVGLGKVTPDQG